MTTQEHTHDSAMSGEVKEKWEKRLADTISLFSEQSSPYRLEQGVVDAFNDVMSDFIRDERSLAQQEILDRVNDEWLSLDLSYDNEKNWGKELNRFGLFMQNSDSLLSTLKDTNI